MPTKPQLVAAVLFAPNYQRKLLNLFGGSIISYIPDPFTGLDVSGHGYNGTPTAVTAAVGPDGARAGSFDGSTSFVNWYSAGLAGAFDPAELTLIVWAKVSAAGVWTDATERRMATITADSNNRLYIFRSTTNNRLSFFTHAGGTFKGVSYDALGGTLGWMCLGITVSAAAGEMKAYAQGAQVGTTQTGLGTWSGALASTACCVGSASTVPASVFSGPIAHALLLNRAATAAEIAQAYQVP